MINLEKESEEYARKMWGEYFDNTYDESCNMLSYGEVCQKDFKAGFELANTNLISVLHQIATSPEPFNTKEMQSWIDTARKLAYEACSQHIS